jgi:hypothetical protein
MTYLVTIVFGWGVLAFGLFIVGLLVVTAIRRRTTWSQTGLVLTEAEKADLENPDSLGADPPAMPGVGAETQGVIGAQVRNDINLLGNGL